MKKILLAISLTFGCVNNLFAQIPTWSENIATILYQNCTKCHNDYGIAPSSFMDYSDAVKSVSGIWYQVENRLMPPWPADPGYRHYAGERILKQSEIDAIIQWAENGTPLGDINKAPQKPVYSPDSRIGAYDLKIKIPTYTSTASTSDIYRCFSIPANLTENKFIAAVEVVPGNPKIVHHVLVFQDTTDKTDKLDKADPLPGYTNFGGTGSSNSILLAPYVPGAEPIIFPGGTGVKMYKNARIIIQIHYPQGTNSEKDSTYIVIRFTNKPGVRELFIAPLLHHSNITNGPFLIPKDQVKTFYQSFITPLDISLLSVMPHMHLIGKSTKVFAKPAGTDTIPLVRIKDWDFHWQGEYKFQYIQKITAGTKIQSIVTYDNTLNNHNQPNNPTKAVTLGEATTAEMMLTYFYFMLYQAGDENILQDSILGTPSFLKPISKKVKVYPNPANDVLNINLSYYTDARLQIIDHLGKIVIEKTFEAPMHDALLNMNVNIGDLKPGIYSVVVRTKDGSVWQNKFVKL